MVKRNRAAAWKIGMAVFSLCLAPAAAHALTINPIFDSSITRQAGAATIEQAFGTAAGVLDRALTSPVTVNVQVSWGRVGPYAIPGGAVSASVDELYGYFTTAQIESWLPSNDIFPAHPATGNKFVLASAEAKALGLVAAQTATLDGFVGFGLKPANFSFTAGSTKPGTYSFIAAAEHELEEVLGRISGIGDGYAAPLDLFRYSNGSPSFSRTARSYFSINGGRGQDGPNFNNNSGGDRSDWLTTASSRDAQDAYLYSGKTLTLSQADFDALGELGYTEPGDGPGAPYASRRGTVAFALIPEPTSITLLGGALTMLLALAGRSRMT